MRCIKILGSKQHPIPYKRNKFSNKKLDSSDSTILITGVDPKFIDNKIYLYIIGNNLDENKTYDWTINFDNGDIITPTSNGTTLILNQTNSIKYLESNSTKILIHVDDYSSQIIQL